MSMLEQLRDPQSWEAFYRYKESLPHAKRFTEELRSFVDRKAYLPVCDAIEAGARFPLPRKKILSKSFSRKKRTVYLYPHAENTVLKLLTFLLCRTYDGLFSANLYSFRAGKTAKQAVEHLCKAAGSGMCAYKADISNYFNSIPVEKLLPKLAEALKDDPSLCAFLSRLLLEKKVLYKGKQIEEEKGIMAGTPPSAFYANLYLKDLDARFARESILYARYSDDIIVFGNTPEELAGYAQMIRAHLGDRGLSVNPLKEMYFTPVRGWSFLGFDCVDGKLDVAASSVEKIKGKMRRKMRALKRWQDKNRLSPDKPAKAFVRIFNHKLFGPPEENELSWKYWFFPVIQTVKSLKQIDNYAQDCLRYLMSETRSKSRFNVRYSHLKAIGYRNLVHEYYSYRKPVGELSEELEKPEEAEE